MDQTVLANEQVDEKGRSWRSGALVEKKLLKQWFIRTSEFATALRDGLSGVPANWFDIVDLQRNWIGEIKGHRVQLEVWDEKQTKRLDTLSIFTENVAGLLGAAFVTVPADHELCAKYKLEERGDRIGQVVCRNPVTGDFIPIFVAEDREKRIFGADPEAHLGVPSLDETDKHFATAHPDSV